MLDPNDEKIRMLVKVSTLYYIEGLNQKEIGERLGISRPQISRMLSAAKEEGIVRITIHNPFSEEHQIERDLIETFGMKNAVVIHVPGADQQLIDLHLARAGAELLDTILKEKDVVGVMAGRSVAAVGTELGFIPRKNVQFVPLVGGWGAEGALSHANSNTRLFGEKLKAKYYLLNAPAIVASKETRDIILAEPEIAEVMNVAKRANVALMGIGQVSEEATIVKSGHFSREDILDMKAKGAVANFCTSFMDETGNVIPYDKEERMIGLTAQDIRKIENVIAFASGKDKVKAIRATLRGEWIDTLVTDMSTAKELLSC